MGIIKAIYLLIRAFLVSRLSLAAENLALRQQVAVYKQSVKRPKLRPRDRVFWVLLSRLWSNWRSALAIVQPETVIKWHRQGFKLYWRWKSRAGKPGRPPIQRELRDLIRRMSRENPLWGAPRILSELLLLGYQVAEGTVAKYMVRIEEAALSARGERSWPIMFPTSLPATSSPFRRSLSASSTCSSCSVMTGDGSFTST